MRGKSSTLCSEEMGGGGKMHMRKRSVKNLYNRKIWKFTEQEKNLRISDSLILDSQI